MDIDGENQQLSNKMACIVQKCKLYFNDSAADIGPIICFANRQNNQQHMEISDINDDELMIEFKFL
jgi:hypothetical protein